MAESARGGGTVRDRRGDGVFGSVGAGIPGVIDGSSGVRGVARTRVSAASI